MEDILNVGDCRENQQRNTRGRDCKTNGSCGAKFTASTLLQWRLKCRIDLMTRGRNRATSAADASVCKLYMTETMHT